MEWVLLLGGVALLVFLFVSNGRMRGDVDRLQQEQRVIAGNLERLTKLYESLLAARHAPGAAAAAPAPATPPAQPAATMPHPAAAEPLPPAEATVPPGDIPQ